MNKTNVSNNLVTENIDNSRSNKNQFFSHKQINLNNNINSRQRICTDASRNIVKSNDDIKKRLTFNLPNEESSTSIDKKNFHKTISSNYIKENITSQNEINNKSRAENEEVYRNASYCKLKNCPNLIKIKKYEKIIFELNEELKTLKFVNSTLHKSLMLKEEYLSNSLKTYRLGFIKDKINLIDTSSNNEGNAYDYMPKQHNPSIFNKDFSGSLFSKFPTEKYDSYTSSYKSRNLKTLIDSNLYHANSSKNFYSDNQIINNFLNKNNNMTSGSNFIKKAYNMSNVIEESANDKTNNIQEILGIHKNNSLSEREENSDVRLKNKLFEKKINSNDNYNHMNINSIRNSEKNFASNKRDSFANKTYSKHKDEKIIAEEIISNKVNQEAETNVQSQDTKTFYKTNFIYNLVSKALAEGNVIPKPSQKNEGIDYRDKEKTKSDEKNEILSNSNNRNHKNDGNNIIVLKELKNENDQADIKEDKLEMGFNQGEKSVMNNNNSKEKSEKINEGKKLNFIEKLKNSKYYLKGTSEINAHKESKEFNKFDNIHEFDNIVKLKPEEFTSQSPTKYSPGQIREEAHFNPYMNPNRKNSLLQNNKNSTENNNHIVNKNFEHSVNSIQSISKAQISGAKIATFNYNRNSLTGSVTKKQIRNKYPLKQGIQYPTGFLVSQNANATNVINLPSPTPKYMLNQSSHYNKILGLFNKIQNSSKTSNNRVSFLGYSDNVLKRMVKSDLITEIGKLTNNDDEFILCMRNYSEDNLLLFSDLISSIVADYQYSVQLIRRIKTFLTISVKLVSITNINEAVKVIINNMNEILHCENSNIYVYDRHSKLLILQENGSLNSNNASNNTHTNGENAINNNKENKVFQQQNSYNCPKSRSYAEDQGLIGWVFKNNMRQKIDDSKNDYRLSNANYEFSGSHPNSNNKNPNFQSDTNLKSNNTMSGNKKTILCVPLRDEDGYPIGVVESINKKGGYFTNDDVELIEIFAKQISCILNNSLQYDEFNTHISRLRLMLDIALKLPYSECFENFVVQTETGLMQIWGINQARLYYVDLKESKGEIIKYKNHDLEKKFKPIGIIGKCFLKREMICTLNIYENSDYNSLIDIEGCSCLLTFPIFDFNQQKNIELMVQMEFNSSLLISGRLNKNHMDVINNFSAQINFWYHKNKEKFSHLKK